MRVPCRSSNASPAVASRAIQNLSFLTPGFSNQKRLQSPYGMVRQGTVVGMSRSAAIVIS